MKEFQFSRSFDIRKLCNMSVEVYIFKKALTEKILIYPVAASENFTTFDKTLVRTFS